MRTRGNFQLSGTLVTATPTRTRTRTRSPAGRTHHNNSFKSVCEWYYPSVRLPVHFRPFWLNKAASLSAKSTQRCSRNSILGMSILITNLFLQRLIIQVQPDVDIQACHASNVTIEIQYRRRWQACVEWVLDQRQLTAIRRRRTCHLGRHDEPNR
jgi:hypothetical protein